MDKTVAQKQTVMLTAKVPADLHRQTKVAAAALGMTMERFLVHALTLYHGSANHGRRATDFTGVAA